MEFDVIEQDTENFISKYLSESTSRKFEEASKQQCLTTVKLLRSLDWKKKIPTIHVPVILSKVKKNTHFLYIKNRNINEFLKYITWKI